MLSFWKLSFYIDLPGNTLPQPPTSGFLSLIPVSASVLAVGDPSIHFFLDIAAWSLSWLLPTVGTMQTMYL